MIFLYSKMSKIVSNTVISYSFRMMKLYMYFVIFYYIIISMATRNFCQIDLKHTLDRNEKSQNVKSKKKSVIKISN